MENNISRQKFLTSLLGSGSFLLLSKNSMAASYTQPQITNANYIKGDVNLPANFPAQNPDLVQEMVGASHGQLDKVKELLTTHSELAKATWDWGYGDWETALGAASHVGNKEIAELLMAHGARPDLFTFTMLGNLNAVKAMIEGNPGVQKIRGPHSITLLSHAKIRLATKNISEEDKIKAQAMVDYLTALGDADEKQVNLKISDDEKKQFIGKYKFGETTNEVLIVEVNTSGVLNIKKEGQKFGRTLYRISDTIFAPTGAPYVQIIFELKDLQSISLSIHDPAPIVKAIRV